MNENAYLCGPWSISLSCCCPDSKHVLCVLLKVCEDCLLFVGGPLSLLIWCGRFPDHDVVKSYLSVARFSAVKNKKTISK